MIDEWMNTVTTATKGTVLIIEDNLLNLDMASELLEIAGFQTFEAEDANVGLKMAREVHPDLILMDLHLPFKDGFVTTQTLKADPELKDIPVVAFTALAMREDQEKALAYGCAGVISKPIDVNNFASDVERYLPSSAKGDEGQPVTAGGGAGDVPASAEAKATAEGQQTHSAPKPYGATLRSAPESHHHISAPPMPSPVADTTVFEMDRVKPVDLQSHRILVVDDNPMNVELLKDSLESMGQDVITAYSGHDAIKLAQAERPDLILLDIMMPDLDGYGVLDVLQRDTETAAIPVIFISALNKTQDMVRGFKHGTYDYITKPFKVEEVKARIMASLRIKDLQDILRRERDKLSAIFRNSADAIVLLAPDKTVLSANPRFGEWFNLSLSPEGTPEGHVNFIEVVGCQCNWNTPCPIHQDNVVLVPGEKPRKETDEAPVLLENAVLTRQNGELQYLNIHAGKVTGATGKMEGYVVVVRDVTKEKTIQQSKETFVATLTHDLKTPIRAEYQALELLKTESFGPMTDEQKEILKEIIQSNRYMSRLVDSLLTTYKVEEGKLELRMESVDLNALIQREIYGPLRPLTSEKELEFKLALDESIGKVNIDTIEIQRVLKKLVQNAVPFNTEHGTVTLSTELLPGGDRYRVAVKDTGPGIAPEDLPVLFDRYKSMARKFQQVGTGLGLYLSKKIVELHGGAIGVESHPGEGSLFYFEMPVTGPKNAS